MSLRGCDEAGNRNGKAKSSKDDIKSKEKHGEATDPQRQSAQPPIRRPSLFTITSLAAPLQELEDGYAALLENAKLCLSETKLLNHLEVPNCENRTSDLEALSKGQVNNVVRPKILGSVKVVAEAIVADSRDGGQNGCGEGSGGLGQVVQEVREVHGGFWPGQKQIIWRR